MKRKTLLIIVISVVVLVGGWFVFSKETKAETDITTKVRKGKFDVIITVTGELRAKNQTDITAPVGLRNAGIYQIKINDLVAEGTVVKPGDYVASLDKTEVMNKLNEEALNVQKKQSEYNQTQLDTAIQLREARDELVTLEYALKERQLEKEQSAFEAPAIRQQVDINYEKAVRTLDQKRDVYKNKVAQAVAKMSIVSSDLQKAVNRLKMFQDLGAELTIIAPKAGMIIYAKEWNGRKRVVGSSINVWDPEVANVPDLSEMEVISFVNEVDIQKVKPGQKVEIGLDADPNKKLDGKVKTVASIGEQRPGQDAKVFEVVIDVLTVDSTLRPSMTTSCHINYGTFENALIVPLDAINVSGNKSYVFKKSGGTLRQQVLVEATNSKDACIKMGLSENDEVYLKDLTDTASMEWALLPDSIINKPKINKPDKPDTGKKQQQQAAAGGDIIIIEE